MANKKYPVKKVVASIKGTGGVISALASNLDCEWHTAKRYIDNSATVREAWEAERNRVTDKAKHNIIKSINDGDLQISKWYLQVIDKEFMPKEKVDVTTKGEKINQDDPERIDRAMSTFADAVREIISEKSAGEESTLDSSKQTTMAGNSNEG